MKNKINLYRDLLLLSFTLGLTYCHKEPKLKDILVNNCYWDVLDKRYANIVNTCFKFNEGGDCQYFNYSFFNRQRTDSVYLYDDDDNIRSHTWELKDDSLFIRGHKFKVLRYMTDSVYLKLNSSNDTVFLIKNCKTYYPKDRISK